MRCPLRDGDGRFFADERVLDEIEGQGQVVFRYTDNQNGSAHDIAGIVNREGNVLGMMPHPERALDMLLGSEDGLPLFQSLMAGVLR